MRGPFLSGWCETGRHGRCHHHLQAANDKRRDLFCACKCHKLVRAMSWAKQR